MSDNTEEETEYSIEEGVSADSTTTVTLEIPINNFEEEKKELLEENGVDVEQQLALNLQKQVEDLIHTIYQQGRYQDR